MGWIIFSLIVIALFSEARFGWGLVAGVLIHSAYISSELDQSAIDGWIGRGDDVYSYEYVCRKADRSCLEKHDINLEGNDDG